MNNNIGQIFNKFKIIEFLYNKRDKDYYTCSCLNCGVQICVRSDKLNRIRNCKCYKSLIGQKFGQLKVTKRLNIENARRQIYWQCLCECGNVCEYTTTQLRCNFKTSCEDNGNHAPKKSANQMVLMVGQKVGKLTIIHLGGLIGATHGKKKYAYCKCECGYFIDVPMFTLRNGYVKTCGFQPCKNMGSVREENLEQYRIVSAKTMYQANYDDGDISFDKFLELSQLPCFYCGTEKSNNFNRFKVKRRHNQRAEDNGNFQYNGLDRLDNSINHMLDNVVPCCKTCNWMKGKLSRDEFLLHLKKIINYLNIGD